MYALIIVLPLLSFIAAALFGRFIGTKGSSIITSSTIALSFLLAIFYIIQGSNVYLDLGEWVPAASFIVHAGFQFDELTMVMLAVITSISTIVHIYSCDYMGHDPHLPRFLSYLSLFTFFMIILVTGDNLLQLFIGWEGVGVCSFLLINFWWTRIQANQSAIKAMVVNRIGDLGLILAMGLALFNYGTIQFDTLLHLCNSNTDLITCFLLLGAIGKSAQLGLHTWLPDAMEGPTPVSALIHAATMVTAGVYLILRTSPLFELANHDLVLIFGTLTAFFGATVGVVQNDIKRIIAYSTCSQLGYMVLACGLSSYSLALYHLSSHAVFKALLFLAAGSVIHALQDEQDIRKMGGLINVIPLTYAFLLIGSLSLAGFPYLSGFYSKEPIIQVALVYPGATWSYVLASVSAILTAFYSFRLLTLVFLTKPNGFRTSFDTASESSVLVTAPLTVLSLGAIGYGYMTKDYFIGPGRDLFVVQAQHSWFLEAEFVSPLFKILPVASTAVGITAGVLFAGTILPRGLVRFLSARWYWDVIYNRLIVEPIMSFGYHITFKLMDKGMLESFGPTAISNWLSGQQANLSRIESGFVYHYSLTLLVGLTVFLALASGFVPLEALLLILIPLVSALF